MFGFQKPTKSEESMEVEDDSEVKDIQDPEIGNDPETKSSLVSRPDRTSLIS